MQMLHLAFATRHSTLTKSSQILSSDPEARTRVMVLNLHDSLLVKKEINHSNASLMLLPIGT